ncbi:MAG: hypothetical protein LBH32_09755 [Dysgonamonadaceae bacterium]|jgi:hypothetical protein|nr:hypothetical protein [Dysgonamonadaceae bacterium]
MKKIVLTAAAIIIACISAFSQSLTEKRHVKTTALQVYENYKVVMSSLYGRDNYIEDNFMALFDDKALIYNDIVPVNTPSRLTPAKYFAKFRATVKRIYPEFSSFTMGEPVLAGGKWHIKCSFTRTTRFRTQTEMQYPQWTFHYTMTIKMEKKYDADKKVYRDAVITDIVVDKPLENYFILENKDNMSMLNVTSGEPVTGWDEEYHSRIFPESEWDISDIKISESGNIENVFDYSKSRFSKNRADEHFYQLKFIRFPKNIYGAGFNYSLGALGNKMSGENVENFPDISMKSSAFSFSVFYGKQIAQMGKAILFLNGGLDLSWYSYNYNGKYSTKYPATDDDDDGDDYTRKIEINSLKETITTFSPALSGSVEYVSQIGEKAKNPFFFSLKAGVFIEPTLSSKAEYNINADYHGIYDKYFEIEFDHYYDYGNFDVKGKEDLDFNFNGGLILGAGLWYALNNSNLLKVEALCKIGFSSPLKYNKNYVISENKDSYNSLLYSTNQGLRNIYLGFSWVKTINSK